MDIRRLSDIARAAQPAARLAPPQAPAGQPGQGGRAGDRDEGLKPQDAETDTPFWLVAMSTDRLARRRHMPARAFKAAARTEAAWIRQIAQAAGPRVTAWAGALPATLTLADWQALAEALAEAAGGFRAPRVVWLPGLPDGRGQFLFRVDGNLLQLKPGAGGSRAEWAATVAHETFHHLQQELVTALYRGEPALDGPLAELAAYYRDARNTYDALGPACPPDRHRRQPLEVGAWAYGEAIARALPQRG
ncbi:MAG: hypothetical protein ACK46X_13745 [Candidatus Sericytochromatia bacterium]